MRPRELTINGFRSYADEVVFDWTGRGLVGIVGPIGSGKSSILDAVAFALYGKTPRIERDTKSLINQRRDSAQVALTFEVDGTTWKAVRVLRRAGQPAHTLYRIEGDQTIEVTDKSREMGEHIEELLGLDFDAFQRSVLLAQNQFATFLEATGTDRNQVLKGVFGFERLDVMRAILKERLEAVDRGLATLAGRRASADVDAADLDAKRSALGAAEERERTLEELRAPFEETKGLRSAAEGREAEAARRLGRLDELADRIPDRAETDAVVAEAARAGGVAQEADVRLADAGAARIEAAHARDQVVERIGGRRGLDEAGELVHGWRAATTQVSEAEARLATTLTEQEKAAVRARETAKAADRAEEERERLAQASREVSDAVDRARSELQAAQQAHRAHSLRADLVVGEPCPVCAQTVTVAPADSAPSPLATVEQVVEASRQAAAGAVEDLQAGSATASTARAEATAAAEATASAEMAVGEARSRVEAAQRQAEAARASAVERLGEGEPQEKLAERRAELDAAEERLTSATRAEDEARSAAEAAHVAAKEAERSISELRTRVASVAGALDLAIEIGDTSRETIDALVGIREAWIGRRQAAEGDRARAGEEAAAAAEALREMLEAAGLGAGDDVVEVIAAARTERAGIEAEVQLLEKRLAELARLADDEAELVKSGELLRRLHGDLAPSRFLEFVLDERRRALGDLASEHLEVLTGGRYRFDDSGDFLLLDLTAADSVRTPASLSGGETFLAALALALALAEIVAREGGRLDAFFLDEGFGSLDPEHLDLAMDGVERLVTSGPGRLVVVVSHVPAMRERIEDLVVLDRDVMTGNTQVLAGSTPP